MEGTLSEPSLGNFTIITDDIKQITLGNYTSYTMVLKKNIPQSSVFYNLTIEDKAGISRMFITEYKPNQEWLLDKTKPFDGGITTYTIDLKEDPGDGGGGGGSGSGGGSEDGTAYPYDCQGEVITSQIMVPYPCGCGHWSRDECDGCNSSPQYPGYNWRTAYECYESSSGENPPDPDPDPSGGGGGNSNESPDPELHSLTILMPDGSTMETPELLTDMLTLNPNENQKLTEDLPFSDKVYLFIATNQFSEEAKLFGNEAIDAYINGGEVDFEDPLEDYDFTAESTEVLAFEQDYRAGMSSSEEAIFDNLSRIKQLDYLHSGFLAKTYAEIYYEPQTLYNGIGDAYRHALWNAIATIKLGETLTEQLTTAHEDRAPEYLYEYKEVEMDLFNNEVGREIGNQSTIMLMMKVKFALEKGDLRYLSNINPRATANSNLIPTHQ